MPLGSRQRDGDVDVGDGMEMWDGDEGCRDGMEMRDTGGGKMWNANAEFGV